VQIWSPATTPGHFVTAEIQEGLTAYEWRVDRTGRTENVCLDQSCSLGFDKMT